MKNFLLALVFVSGAASASAQSVIDWFTADAAGGSAVSANYLVNDTLGQADAVRMTSANYTIVGGFWALESVGPFSGLPELHIALATPGNVLLWWPSPSTSFVLQENTDVTNPAGWADVAAAVSDNGVIRSLTRPSAGATRFYRLRKP